MLSREVRHFLQLFAEKLNKTPNHGSLLEKVDTFGQIDDFSCFIAKWGTFCNFLPKSWPKRRIMVVCSKKLKHLAKWTFLRAFSRNEVPFATFRRKVDANAKNHGSLLEKVQTFGQMDVFSCFFAKWGTFCNFPPKSWRKRQTMVVWSKKFKYLAKWTFYHALSRNQDFFPYFCRKVDPNPEPW